MLIPIKTMSLVYNINPKSIIHVGAHHAEEFNQYKVNGWGKVFWFEAIEENIEIIERVVLNSGDEVINAAVWSKSGNILNFNIASNSQSTSTLEFGQHSSLYPDIRKVSSRKIMSLALDDYFESKTIPEFINLDIQGTELEALKGFSKSLNKVKWVYTEVNKKEIYKNCALVEDIDEFLSQYGFTRFKTRWVLNHGWGDALYVKEEIFEQNLKSMVYELFDWINWKSSQAAYSTKLTLHKFLRKFT
jgi:FkbM family methyltransferase